MKRVIVIGSPGAGKSTFSRKLKNRTGIPLYHLDNIWHLPDRTTISREELRLKNSDTVFLLDYPLEVCLAGVSARRGKKREDHPWIEYEIDEEFRRFITAFPDTKLPMIYKLLHQYSQGKDIHIFRSREEAEEYLENG